MGQLIRVCMDITTHAKKIAKFHQPQVSVVIPEEYKEL